MARFSSRKIVVLKFILLFGILSEAAGDETSPGSTSSVKNGVTATKSRWRHGYIKRDSYADAAALAAAGQVLGTGSVDPGSSNNVYPNYDNSYTAPGGIKTAQYPQADYSQYYSAASTYGVPGNNYGGMPPSYGVPESPSGPLKYHYKVMPQSESNNGWALDSFEDYDDKGKGSDGLYGLFGLLGLKPLLLLKKLFLPWLPILLPFAPILLPLAPLLLPLFFLLAVTPIFLPGVLLVAAILLFPVPALFFPMGSLSPTTSVLLVGRSHDLSNSTVNATLPEQQSERGLFISPVQASFTTVGAQLLKNVPMSALTSAECIERMSCELVKLSSNFSPKLVPAMLGTIRKWLGDKEIPYLRKINVGMGKQGDKCHQFACPRLSSWGRVKGKTNGGS